MRQSSRATGPTTTTQRSGGVRYRISVLLVALAVVPLTGVGWFTTVEVRSAESARQQADSVEAAVTRLALLTELTSRIQDERNWSSGRNAIAKIGLDPSLVKTLTGLDIPAEFELTRTRIDTLVGQLQLDSVAEQLILARAKTNLPDTAGNLFVESSRYDSVGEVVADESQRMLDDLLLTAGRMKGGQDLVATLRVLESSTVAQQSVSGEFTALFSAQFSDAELTSDLAALLGRRAVRAEAESDIRRTASGSSRSRQAMATIDASADEQVFELAVRKQIDDGLNARSAAKQAGLGVLTSDIDGVAAQFRAGNESTRLYFTLVGAASDDALAASSTLAVRAQQQLDRAIATVAILAAISLLFSAAATRAVVRPVRRLAEVAARISDGDSRARFGNAHGSIEIVAAGRAMDAAAAHLELAEQQAKALAEGDLDHPILSQATTGQLGASLQDAVEALAGSMQEREEFRRRMTHEATHDGLTQIANRNASLAQLRRGLARVRRSDAQLAVLFIDLDGFKDVNDTHGHHAGDMVLRATAQRLVNAVRDGDHVGRLGGDEFVVIAEPVSGVDEAVALAERLVAELGEPIQIEHSRVAVRASIGIALSQGHDEMDSIDLLRDADLAVYKAKADGRGRVEICDDALRSALFERADIERALRQAIAEVEFVLFYQPIIEPGEQRLCGFEALIRWNRPGQGMVSPDNFIPVAERSDLIVAIDRWVVGAAVRQIKAWDAEGAFPGVPVSVNVSGRHLGSPSLIDDVLSPLRDHDVDPSRLVVEITESALLEDLEGAAAKLQILRSHGIRIAIDDFGTGYTSLAHLKSLPIDILKIDRSYTNDESATSLVQLIIDTGHLLGASITAEGIETSEQATLLAAMGSDELQGYLYGRPVPPADLHRTRPVDRPV